MMRSLGQTVGINVIEPANALLRMLNLTRLKFLGYASCGILVSLYH